MLRHLVLVILLTTACGGSKQAAKQPIAKAGPIKKPVAPVASEADREAQRHAAAVAIVPAGSTCLPAALKADNAPRLELAAVGQDAIVCAIDTDRTRLLGAVGCWKITDFETGALSYQDPAPLPGRGLDVLLDDHCARGYCLPKEAKIAGIKIAHMAWNLEATKVAVLVGDDVHLFDAKTKTHESSFSIRGDKGITNDPTAIHFVDGAVFVEGADQGPFSAVWGYKLDGTAIGPITAIGSKDDKPLSTFHGSFSVLDKNHVAVAERGFETLTTYDVATGMRGKLVRKLGKPVCKPDELTAFWHDGDKVTDKCKDSVMKMSGHLIGATAVRGAKSLVVLLRNDRLGELAALDPKTLAEKKTIKLPWCDKADDALVAPKKPAKANP